FRALAGEDAVVIAHVGGRYADIKCAHDGRLERSVEVHSTWGTFEWLLHDAFDKVTAWAWCATATIARDARGRPNTAPRPSARSAGSPALLCPSRPATPCFRRCAGAALTAPTAPGLSPTLSAPSARR